MEQHLEAWLPQLLQTNDSAFPSGTYAHSFGLEGMVALGVVKDLDTLRDFLEITVIPLLRQVELPVVRLAYEAAQEENLLALRELSVLYGAMKGARELRQASLNSGRQRLQLLDKLWPHPLLQRVTGDPQFQPYAPVVYGLQTALAQTPVEAALIAYYYQTLAATVTASLKLLRLGQLAAQTLLIHATQRMQDVVAASKHVSLDDIGCLQPLLDIASAQHETAETRIFIS